MNSSNSIIDKADISISKDFNNSCKEDSKKTKNNIKGIFFDFDGVLSSFAYRIGWPMVSAALMVKPDITEEEIKEASFDIMELLTTLEKKPKITSLMKFIFKLAKKLNMSNFQAIKFMITIGIVYAKGRKNIVPRAGVRQVLKDILTKDYKVVLVTNTSKGIIDIAKKKIPEINDFDLIITREDTKVIKPHAKPFKIALKTLNLRPEQVVSVGDQASDIIAGKKVGVKTIALTNKFMKHTRPHLKAQKNHCH